MSSQSNDHLKNLKIAAAWSYISTAGSTVIQFISGVILARILEPGDFGVFAAVSAYTTILMSQIRFGIPSAIIQAKELHESTISASFWIMQLFAFLATIIAWLLSAWLEATYGDPRFTPILALLCINFFIMPYSLICGSILRRNMDFRSVSRIQLVVGMLAAIPGIILALIGYGPFSLAIAGILSALLNAFLLGYKSRWLPKMPIQLRNFKRFITYAFHTNINSTLSVTTERIDNILIGAYLGTFTLGIYTRAYSLSKLIQEQFTNSLQPLVLSGLSRIQDDSRASSELFFRFINAVTLISFPLLLILLCVSDRFIVILYGEKWEPSVVPLQILIIGSFASIMTLFTRSFLAAHDIVGRQSPIQIANLALTTAAILIFYESGLTSIAAALATKEYIILALSYRLTARMGLSVTIADLVKVVLPSISATIASGAMYALYAHSNSSWIQSNAALSALSDAVLILFMYFFVIMSFYRFMPLNSVSRLNIAFFLSLMRRTLSIKHGQF